MVAAIVAAIASSRCLRARADRRRRVWFDGLAHAMSAQPEHRADRGSRFEATVTGRIVDVVYRYFGASMGNERGVGWTLVCSTALRGVSDIYNVRFERKRGGIHAKNFGFEPRQGWITPALRAELETLLAPALHAASVDVEGGRLTFRSYRRLDAESVRAVVTSQAAAADQVESALGSVRSA